MDPVEIPLRGRTYDVVALVDDVDADLVLASGKWYRVESSTTPGLFHARTSRGVKMHRLVLGLAARVPQVDHVNGDGLDNRRANLRLASSAQNQMNKRGWRSGYKGVIFFGRSAKARPWRAQITVDGKRHYLGYYATEEEAARAYDAAALDLHGEFARLNFPVTLLGACPKATIYRD